ncbi:MAG: hypothetical protein J4F46_10505 [Dehalococcoidia bacterium]|nr:hypothetical protein [Dehalococcoidia bacterium]
MKLVDWLFGNRDPLPEEMTPQSVSADLNRYAPDTDDCYEDIPQRP